MYESPKIVIDDKLTIQIYICYLLEQLGELTDEQLNDIIAEIESVSSFDYLEALSIAKEKELISSRVEKEKTICFLLPQGKTMAKEFFRRIPLSVREKSLEYGKRLLELAELERSIVCRIKQGGCNEPCYLTVKFLNEIDGSELMSLRVFAPNYEQAKEMRDRFYEKPSDTVTKIMNMFIKDSYL